MRTTLTMEEYKDIERLVDCALNAPNKKVAQSYINKIKPYGYDLQGRAKNIFNDLICYVENASGKVTDKDSKVYWVTMELSKIRTYGVESEI